MEETIELLISSRDETDRKNIISILSDQNNFRITGVEKEEAGTIIKSENIKPDILILDLQPPGMSGYELAPIVHRKSPSTFIIILSDKEEENIINLILRTGVSGILMKNTDMRILTSVVKIVNVGGYFFSTAILTGLLNTVIDRSQSMKEKLNYCDMFFSSVERKIIIDIIQGYSDDQIAEHYNLSAGSVRNYITEIKRKTNSKKRIQLIVYAFENGLLCLDQTRLKQ
ncbi:MAG: response regulator transcription factor [Treponema sp.]|nr:response regulator transcription factor [Treponema sp.]